jgi:hypothetical protein
MRRWIRTRPHALLIVAGILAALGLLMAVWRPLGGLIVRRKIARAEADARMLATGIASLAIDFCGGGRPDFIDTGVTDGSAPRYAFRMAFAASDLEPSPPDRSMRDVFLRHSLSTPVAYIRAYPRDPFTGDSFGYWSGLAEYDTHIEWAGAYVLSSAGPDGDHDVDQREVFRECNALLETQETIPANWTHQERRRALPAAILNGLYDPTNGLRSNGDLVWISLSLDFQWLNETGAVSYGWWGPPPPSGR